MAPKVFVTGGSGFIAAHILRELLDHGYHVVFTVRSAQKGSQVVEAYPDAGERLSFLVVEDMTKADAYDEAVQSSQPLDYVMHTASPYHFNIRDPVKDFHEPAVLGTRGILRAVARHAPTVRRVVVTSSFAAMVNREKHADVYDESCWGPVTDEQAMDPAGAYRASKIYAERAAWAFMAEHQPTFDLVVLNPPMVFGPVAPFLASFAALNTSNERIRAMVQGDLRRAGAGLPATGGFLFVDVRDVATAHVRALDVPAAVDDDGGVAGGGRGVQRFFVAAGHYSNKRICDAVRRAHPALAPVLPDAAATVDDLPARVYGFDNQKSRRLLGLTYRSLDECVDDAAASMLALERKLATQPRLAG